VQKAVERENAAFPVIVRTQDEDRVFQAHDQRERPDRERDAA
jgi:hypothetical protein